MWFIGINPGDPLPHPSLLSKFRTTRLKDVTLDDIMTEVVRQCVDKGLINADNGASIDTTHILANTTKKVPERVMKHLAKKIFKAMDKADYEIPDYTQIENHKEAKQVMKTYLEDVIDSADERASHEVKEAREILASPLFIEQKGIRSITDTDARVGYKSKRGC
jgi:glycerate-2-kinase